MSKPMWWDTLRCSITSAFFTAIRGTATMNACIARHSGTVEFLICN